MRALSGRSSNRPKGQLLRDQAQLENARLDQRRYETLAAQGVIARQQSDTQIATVHQFEGAIKADQGQIDNINVQLVYCRIESPLNGRIGLRLVDRGNIVHATDANGLATITQLQPIAVIFNLAQDFLPEVMKRSRAGQTLPVEAWDRDLHKKLATGKLLTVDNAIDTATGTARFKAEFPNDDDCPVPQPVRQRPPAGGYAARHGDRSRRRRAAQSHQRLRLRGRQG